MSHEIQLVIPVFWCCHEFVRGYSIFCHILELLDVGYGCLFRIMGCFPLMVLYKSEWRKYWLVMNILGAQVFASFHGGCVGVWACSLNIRSTSIFFHKFDENTSVSSWNVLVVFDWCSFSNVSQMLLKGGIAFGCSPAVLRVCRVLV